MKITLLSPFDLTIQVIFSQYFHGNMAVPMFKRADKQGFINFYKQDQPIKKMPDVLKCYLWMILFYPFLPVVTTW